MTIVPLVVNLTPEESTTLLADIMKSHPEAVAGVGNMLPVPETEIESFKRGLERMNKSCED